MKRFIIYIFLSAWVSCIAMCYAQEPIDSLYLSLDSCRAMALRENVNVKKAEQTVEKAQAEKNAILSKYFPKVSGIAATTYMFENIEMLNSIDPLLPSFNINSSYLPSTIQGPLNEALSLLRQEIVNGWKPIDISLKGAFIAGLTLQQPIFAGGRIVQGNRMAKIGTEMAAENLKLKQDEAIVDAEKAYWLYVSVREKVRLAETYTNLLNEVEKQVTSIEEADMVDQNTLIQVKVKQSEVKMQLQRAKSGLELSRMALCQLIGVPFNTPIVATDTVVQVGQEMLVNTDNDVTNRTEYKLLEKVVQMKEGEVKLALGTYLPTIGVGASLAYMGNISIGGQVDPPYNVSNVMATINIPITDWWEGSQKIKSAQRDKRIAELDLQNNSELMQLQMQQAIFNLTDSYQQIKNAEEALEAAQENLRINRDKYELQLQTLSSLLEAQGTWQQAYSNLIDARIAYRMAEVEYKKISGQL